MTNTACNGTEVLDRIHPTTDFASGTKNGGSITTHPLAPMIRVVTLERPFSLDEWMCVSSLSDMFEGAALKVKEHQRWVLQMRHIGF